MTTMTSSKRMTLCAACIALCYVLPIAFHSVGLGGALSPMHIPVLLCGLICGSGAGLLCGLIGPVLSSLLSGMPPHADAGPYDPGTVRVRFGGRLCYEAVAYRL